MLGKADWLYSVEFRQELGFIVCCRVLEPQKKSFVVADYIVAVEDRTPTISIDTTNTTGQITAIQKYQII